MRLLTPFDSAIAGLSDKAAGLLDTAPDNVKRAATEIRLRRGRSVTIHTPDSGWLLTQDGGFAPFATAGAAWYSFTPDDMNDCFRALCGYSIHSHADDIRQGFITIQGGHRAGICGTAVMGADGVLSGVRDVSSINLRIARQIKGAADELFQRLDGNPRKLLLAGPPGCGKTTLLKDLIRLLSEHGTRVAVVDSRGELAACHRGEPQIDLGPGADVLDGYPKGEGMQIALRTMAPEVIVCDEIGGREDAGAIAACQSAGVSLVASAHCGSLDELLRREHIARLIPLAFERAVILQSGETPGQIQVIHDFTRKDERHVENHGDAADYPVRDAEWPPRRFRTFSSQDPA